MDLGFFDFQLSLDIKAVMFFYQMSFKEQLPDKMILLERGEANINGYALIYMIKQ